ncbi:glycosyltransferase family 2 protein [Cupriavidus basilensis]|uniref:glycosyltransferase family 2 protein n=1 Tax=Cupriavidus basilensis TaxID=68895 RepID=UPI000B01EEA1|nr:glycosyltransferase family A protein [Cupriavidus basilensis]
MCEGMENFTIGITTKNRREDLNYTLKKLIDLGLCDIPIILIDDASDIEIFDDEVNKKFSKMRVIKNKNGRGLIANRNLMVSLSETPFFISLDDDSCFRDKPDFSDIERVFYADHRVAALQLNNVDVNFGCNPSDRLELYQVQMYTGCGHVLRCATFLALGGYREYFMHMCEERDFSQRAWRNGYCVMMYPWLIVDHLRSPVARNVVRNTKFLVRNTVLFNFLNYPIWFGLARAMGVGPISIFKNFREPTLIAASAEGWLSGLGMALRRLLERSPMSISQYRKFRQLPMRS